MKQSLNIELSKELWIFVEGIYTKRDESTGKPSEFDIQDIEITKGDVYNLIYYCNGACNDLLTQDLSIYKRDLWVMLEEFCLEKLEN